MSVRATPQLTLVGRSTSHFTRVARIFAAEARLAYTFEIVPRLQLSEPAAYAGNPALRIPILQSPSGTWYGALNICRELHRSSSIELGVIWPEDLQTPVCANAQELVLQAMSSEVTLLMSRLFGAETEDAHGEKLRRGLVNTLEWLEDHVDAALAELPRGRDLSYLEVTLYCLVRHLPFREVMPVDPYVKLRAFCDGFEARQSVRDTVYRVDA